MTTADQMRGGGHRLRAIREEQKLTQNDIERATASRFGEENRVYAQQVSRIEKGSLDKPPILDLLRIGAVLGLQPDDIAELFGLWPRQQSGVAEQLDPRLHPLIELARSLPPDLLERLMNQVETIVALMKAEVRQRIRDEGAGNDRSPGRPTRSAANTSTRAHPRENSKVSRRAEHAK